MKKVFKMKKVFNMKINCVFMRKLNHAEKAILYFVTKV